MDYMQISGHVQQLEFMTVCACQPQTPRQNQPKFGLQTPRKVGEAYNPDREAAQQEGLGVGKVYI